MEQYMGQVPQVIWVVAAVNAAFLALFFPLVLLVDIAASPSAVAAMRFAAVASVLVLALVIGLWFRERLAS